MIRSSVTDAELLAALSPADLALYLRSLAWTSEAERGGATWVRNPDDEQSEVIFVPASQAMRGYSGYIKDALRMLSGIQGRPELEVFLSVRQATRDAQFIRTQPDTESGTTSIIDAVHSIEHIQQWVLAAAVSEATPRKAAVQPARKPLQATDFLSTVRLGATYPGSFIYSVYIPVPVELGPPMLNLEHPGLDSASTPFARKVSLRLRRATELALTAANEVVSGAGGYESFSRNISNGVTANFCEALVGISGETPRPYSVDFDWAAVRPVETRPSVAFTPMQIEVLGEAARTLRSVEPEENVQIIGAVVRLHRDAKLGPGEVSILGYVDGDVAEKVCRVWVELAEDDYASAVTAHHEGHTVSLHGDLKRSTNRTELSNPRGFRSWVDSD